MESTDAIAAVSKAASQLVTGEAVRAVFSCKNFSISIGCDKSVVRDLAITAVSLYGIYTTSKLIARAIDGIVKRSLGDPREDQDIPEILPGSLHVKLRCFTDERFLEVWTDYESGRMKERLQEEFAQSGIEVEGLKIEIENLDEVNETMRAIESRSGLPGEHTLEMKDEGDIKDENEDEIKDFDNNKASQDEVKFLVLRMERKQDHILESQAEIKVQIKEIERKQDDIKKNDNEIKLSQAQTKVELNEMDDKITGMERKQQQTMKDQMKLELSEIKHKITEMGRTSTQDRIKLIMMIFMIIVVHQALQGSISTFFPANNQDIIILGGHYGRERKSILNTAEKFDIVEGKSTQLPRMNLPRIASASCVYNGDVIVAGGYDGQAGTDLIEILKMNQHPWKWMTFDGKLPVKLSAHDVIVYQDKLYIIGGNNWNENKTSDAIYELALAPPYTAKLLARMPQPISSHGAEIVNGKLFILGGTTTGNNTNATDSVVVYDFIKNEVKQWTSLYKPIWGMSTVSWGNKIIVVGGKDTNDQDLNDVIMYNTETGGSELLPPLKHKRSGSSAVIMHDVIVVLGGWNGEQGHLNSVESFTMGGDQWRELSGMTQKRGFATAVVKLRK